MTNSKAVELSEFSRSLQDSAKFSQAVLSCLNEAKISTELGIGAELEFFLRDASSNKLCELKQSQNFLLELSNLTGWSLFSKNEFTKKILRVSKNLDEKRYHSVKYEHPPHMMEVALAYEDNLLNFREALTHLFYDLKLAAKNSDLIIDISQNVEPNPISWATVGEIESRFEPLSVSRKLIYKSHTESSPDHRIDFTTFTAATQFHVGGKKWWEQHPGFMNDLYKAEFLISGIVYSENKNQFNERWSAYKYVFGDMKLLGFPNLDAWTFEHWINGLLDSPNFQDSSTRLGETVRSLSYDDMKKQIYSLRDLQIIKPKWIGTLEFRSDPAIADFDEIVHLASMRFGAYLSALKPKKINILAGMNFSELSKEWWRGHHVSNFGNDLEQLKNICYESLKSRGLGEEKFI